VFIIEKSFTLIKSSSVDLFLKKVYPSTINYFSLGIMGPKGIAASISSHQWQEFYVESQCFHFDPIVQCASAQSEILIDWHSVPINANKDSFIMQTRKELTRCTEGFSLVQKLDDETSAILAFGTRSPFLGLVEDYFRYREDVSALIASFKHD
jgi:hypothetical protein